MDVNDYFKRGEEYIDKENYSQAVDDFLKAIEMIDGPDQAKLLRDMSKGYDAVVVALQLYEVLRLKLGLNTRHPSNFEEKLRMAESGDADAQYYVSRCYYRGDGVPQDDEAAAGWLRKAAKQGNADAQYGLGVCYSKGRGIPQDYEETAYWFRKAAEQGNADAQYNLGVCYINGMGIPEDKAIAIYWFRKAAEQGNADAQYNLGVCYKFGMGVPEDKAIAIYWLRKAAEQGNAQAQSFLNEGE